MDGERTDTSGREWFEEKGCKNAQQRMQALRVILSGEKKNTGTDNRSRCLQLSYGKWAYLGLLSRTTHRQDRQTFETGGTLKKKFNSVNTKRKKLKQEEKMARVNTY